MDNVNEIIEKTAQAVICEVKKQGMIRDNKPTPYQKTETLLYNYLNFKGAIRDKQDQIDMINAEGTIQRSASITTCPSGTVEIKSEYEKREDMIRGMENSIRYTMKFIKIIDAAIDGIKGDVYYELIPMIYFDNLTREEAAEHFNCDVKTVSRNKKRLINQLQIRMFTDEYILQIFH